MVDVIMADDPLFMVLSTLRDHDDYTCRHSVNVAIPKNASPPEIAFLKTAIPKTRISASARISIPVMEKKRCIPLVGMREESLKSGIPDLFIGFVSVKPVMA